MSIIGCDLHPRYQVIAGLKRGAQDAIQKVRMSQNVFAVDFVVEQVAAVLRFVLRLAIQLSPKRPGVKRQFVCKRSTIGRGDASSNGTPSSAKHTLNSDRSRSHRRYGI